MADNLKHFSIYISEEVRSYRYEHRLKQCCCTLRNGVMLLNDKLIIRYSQKCLPLFPLLKKCKKQ